MRICHVNLARGFSGGEQQTLNLLLALQAQGVKQRLVCYRHGALTSRARAAGIEVTEVRHFVRGHGQGSNSELIHAHCGKSVYWAALEHRLRGTPYIITRRVLRPLNNLATTRWAYQHAAAVVCLSRAIVAQISGQFSGLRTRIIADSSSGFNADPQQVAAIRARWPGKVLIGQTDRLVAIKQHDTTLAAARLLAGSQPQLQFLLLGDGPRRHELAQAAATLANVSLLGHQVDVGSYLAAFDLFLFPSAGDGMGSSILEAMQAGVAVIASDAGGIPDLIDDGDNGLLVPAGDAAALATAIERLLADDNLRQRLITAARERLPAFAPEAIATAYLQLYRELLAA